MKSRLILLCFSALISTHILFAQKEGNAPFVTRTFTAAQLGNLEVLTSGGSISVTGNRTSGYQVDMFVKSANWKERSELSDKEIEDRLDDYDIEIKTIGNRVVASAKRKQNLKWDNNRSISISFVVYSPKKSNSHLVTSGGSIALSNLFGSQVFVTSGGSLKVSNIEGSVSGKTSGGSITVTGCKDNIALETSGGSIKANDLIGKIKLTTSGGSLQLYNLTGEVIAHTSGGSIKGSDLEGTIATGTSGGSIKLDKVDGSLKASTSAGSIEVTMKSISRHLVLATSSGSVRVNMPLDMGANLNLTGSKVSIPLQNFTGQAEKNAVIGKINGGGVEIKLSASSGNVYVNQ